VRAPSARARLAVLLLSPALLTMCVDKAERTSPPRPNVLVIVTDDQRYDTLMVMPAVRSLLAKEGVAFHNAVVTTPLCCPSRASIYSGRYAHNHGVWDNDNTTGHLKTRYTVQHELQQEGYLTAHVDRYLNNWREWTREPPDFDFYAVQLEQRAAYGPRHALVNGGRRRVRAYTTRWIRRVAELFLKRFEVRDDVRPWLMFVTTRAPHLPAIPEPAYAGTDVCCWTRPPSVGERVWDKQWVAQVRSRARFGRHRRRQLRSLKSVDDLVEALIGRLETLRELRNTLIIFTSDNGHLWGEHGLGNKRWPYDESLRVPLLLRWDSADVPRGTNRWDVVANIDVAATIYQAARVTPSYDVDGRSLLTRPRRHRILIEYRRNPDTPSVPRYSGVWSPRSVFLHFPGLGHNEFYEAADRYQLHNLYETGQGPDPTPYLRLIKKWSRCSGRDCP
jgi:arylsulfatase A-like enzyme